MIPVYVLDVYRDTEDSFEEDIYLDEFRDEIDGWVIDALKNMGCVTAKSVLSAPRQMLIDKADLEEDTVDNVIRILSAEFDEEEGSEDAAEDEQADEVAEEQTEEVTDEAPAEETAEEVEDEKKEDE